jgi:thiaminase/transcriptional activator TenA
MGNFTWGCGGTLMKFSDQLWKKCAHIYKAIENHPFNTELANGTLCRDRFHFYMEQDALYLVAFSKALALIAGRSQCVKTTKTFLEFALGALVAERELHTKFLNRDLQFPLKIEKAPACFAYTHYLLSITSKASIEEAIAAVIPCFWIYRDVGQSIVLKSGSNNPYGMWIETYASKEFSDATDLVIEILNDIAVKSPPGQLALMTKAFKTSVMHEWHFWDDAYRLGTIK